MNLQEMTLDDAHFAGFEAILDDDIFAGMAAPAFSRTNNGIGKTAAVMPARETAQSDDASAFDYAVSLLHPALAATAHMPLDLTGLTAERSNGKNIYYPTKENPGSYVYEWILTATAGDATPDKKVFSDDEIEYRAKRINLHKACQDKGICVAAIQQVQVVEDGDALVFRLKVESLQDEVQMNASHGLAEPLSMYLAAFKNLEVLHFHDMFHGDTADGNFFFQRNPASSTSDKFKATLVDLDMLGEETEPPLVNWDISDSKRHDLRQLGTYVADTIDTRLSKLPEGTHASERNLLKDAKAFFDRIGDIENNPVFPVEDACMYLQELELAYHAVFKATDQPTTRKE